MNGGTPPAGPWRGARPELAVAGATVAVAGVASYFAAGWAGLAVVVTVAGAGALAVLRGLLPQAVPEEARTAREKARERPVSGYSHRRFMVDSAGSSLGFYENELRPVLEHLLAARLAERHGVNLYQDPDTARRLLCPQPRDAILWDWIAPSEPTPGDRSKLGIPRRVLVRIIDRLEKL